MWLGAPVKDMPYGAPTIKLGAPTVFPRTVAQVVHPMALIDLTRDVTVIKPKGDKAAKGGKGGKDATPAAPDATAASLMNLVTRKPAYRDVSILPCNYNLS